MIGPFVVTSTGERFDVEVRAGQWMPDHLPPAGDLEDEIDEAARRHGLRVVAGHGYLHTEPTS